MSFRKSFPELKTNYFLLPINLAPFLYICLFFFFFDFAFTGCDFFMTLNLSFHNQKLVFLAV